MTATNNDGARCKNIQRHQPSLTVNEEIAREIGRNSRTLPIFEKGLFEYTYKKHYSLHNNEFLKCNWMKYKRNFESRVFAPFEFPDIRDYHFYSCRNRYLPSLSFHTKSQFRKHMKPGPGVDEFGQMPIPEEAMMKRSGGGGVDAKGKRKTAKKEGNNSTKVKEGEKQ